MIEPKQEIPEGWPKMTPEQRPRKRRKGARVIVRSGSKVLLEADSDPGVPNHYWWVLPGGGVDDGESWRQAAVRELFEETGLKINDEDLTGPVAHRWAHHGYSDRVLIQEEQFFIVDVEEPFTPDPQGLTPKELSDMLGFQWFNISQLGKITVWPANLAELISFDEGFVELGDVEESTVPI